MGPRLNLVDKVMICDMCLDGKGGICNTPGCLFIRKTAPDLSLRQTIADLGGTIDPQDPDEENAKQFRERDPGAHCPIRSKRYACGDGWGQPSGFCPDFDGCPLRHAREAD